MLPWGYKRAFVCCALLFLLGTVFQFLFGGIPPRLLHYPWSVIAALVFTYGLVLIYTLNDRFPRLRRLYDPYAGVASVVSVTALTVLFGLIPQSTEAGGVAAALGWTDMRSSWAFNFLVLYLMVGMGSAAVAGLYRLRTARLASTVSHLAVYLVMAGAFFGSGDKMEALVTATVDQPVAVGEDNAGQPVELPFMLVLHQFILEEYPLRPGPVDTLVTEDGRVMTMPPRFPKRFASDVTLLTGKGERRVEISVNHPARQGAWRIYQYGYDLSQGKESRISELLCVRDGWYPVIAAGLWLLLGAGVLMFVTAGGRRKPKKEEVMP